MMGAYCWEVHENLDSLGRWDRRRLAHGCLARLLPHLCETPLHRYEGIVSERVDRNWTQMRIERLHPALGLAYTAECGRYRRTRWARNPHLCTGPRDWHPFWHMKDAQCYEGSA